MTIPIDCAVNDDYGNTEDRVFNIHVPGLEIAAINVAGVHFRELRGAIRVSQRKFAARHLASGVGNIYWERYGMAPDVAAACLHYLRDLKRFCLDGGHDDLWRWWDSNISDYALVARLLKEAAKDNQM